MARVVDVPEVDLEYTPFHEITCGMTGSGKTYLTKERFRSTRLRSIFWNRQDEDLGVRAQREWDVQDILKPRSRVNLVPPSGEKASQRLLKKVQRDLFRVCKKALSRGAERPLVVFIHDEPDKESPASDKESGGYEMAVRGRRHGIVYNPITQSPTSFSKGARRQCTVKNVFHIDEEEEAAWIRRAGITEDVLEWVRWGVGPRGTPEKTYKFARNVGAGWMLCNPV